MFIKRVFIPYYLIQSSNDTLNHTDNPPLQSPPNLKERIKSTNIEPTSTKVHLKKQWLQQYKEEQSLDLKNQAEDLLQPTNQGLYQFSKDVSANDLTDFVDRKDINTNTKKSALNVTLVLKAFLI